MVSIVVPVFNAENTIWKTLESLAHQTYTNFEILIINDGSTDNSDRLIQKFIKEHDRLSINYISKKNNGVSSARNLGLKKAVGSYIAFIDSDDEWAAGKLATQVKVLKKNPSIYMLACNRNNENFENFFGKKFSVLNEISPKLLLIKNFMITPTVIFKREILGEVGYFDEHQNYAEDLDYFLKIAFKFNAYLYNKSLVTTGGGKPSFGFSGLSSNLWKMEKGELKTIKHGYDVKVINFFEFLLIATFSFLKFLRRKVVSLSY